MLRDRVHKLGLPVNNNIARKGKLITINTWLNDNVWSKTCAKWISSINTQTTLLFKRQFIDFTNNIYNSEGEHKTDLNKTSNHISIECRKFISFQFGSYLHYYFQ